MIHAVVRTVLSKVRKQEQHDEEDGEGAPRVGPDCDPVVAAADRRIRERGLAEFKATIDRMADDPSWAPDPLDVIEAGIPDTEEDGDLFDCYQLHDRLFPET